MSRRAKVILGAASILVLGIGAVSLAQIFGIEGYPGGALKVVYQTASNTVENPGSFTLEIIPEGDNFRVRSTSESVQTLEDLQSGAFNTFLFGLGFRAGEERIDLMPLTVLDEPTISPEVVAGALAFSFLIGTLSGFFPARGAAKLDPVRSLRHE